MTESILVTGGTGFVGRAVVNRLCRHGFRVECLVRTDSPQAERLRGLGAETVMVPVFSSDALLAACQPPSGVIHLAASGVRRKERSCRELVEGHAIPTIAVLEAAALWRPRLVVHTGSWSECAPSDALLDEMSPIAPTTAYGLAKAHATRWAHHIGDGGSLRVVTLRLFNVYGQFERLPRLLPTLVHAAASKQVPELTGGGAVRDFVHVDDVAEAYHRVLLTDAAALPETLQVCTGVGTSIRAFVDAAAQQLEAPWLTRGFGMLPERPDEPTRVVGSTAQLHQTLQWRPKIDITEGIARTVRLAESDG